MQTTIYPAGQLVHLAIPADSDEILTTWVYSVLLRVKRWTEDHRLVRQYSFYIVFQIERSISGKTTFIIHTKYLISAYDIVQRQCLYGIILLQKLIVYRSAQGTYISYTLSSFNITKLIVTSMHWYQNVMFVYDGGNVFIMKHHISYTIVL